MNIRGNNTYCNFSYNTISRVSNFHSVDITVFQHGIYIYIFLNQVILRSVKLLRSRIKFATLFCTRSISKDMLWLSILSVVVLDAQIHQALGLILPVQDSVVQTNAYRPNNPQVFLF